MNLRSAPGSYEVDIYRSAERILEPLGHFSCVIGLETDQHNRREHLRNTQTNLPCIGVQLEGACEIRCVRQLAEQEDDELHTMVFARHYLRE